MMQAADNKLQMLMDIAAEEDRLVKHPCEIKGRDFTYWAKPQTIKEFNSARRACKNKDDDLEMSIRVFIARALDEDGRPQYDESAVPVLTRMLDLSLVSKLINAEPLEDLEVGQVDIKSTRKAASKAA